MSSFGQIELSGIILDLLDEESVSGMCSGRASL